LVETEVRVVDIVDEGMVSSCIDVVSKLLIEDVVDTIDKFMHD
jgi:hypothetical protein